MFHQRMIGAFTILALTAAVFLLWSSGCTVLGEEEYVYYGVVPHKIRYMYLRSRGQLYDPAEWILDYETNSSYLSIVASRNNTSVRIYTLPDERLVSKAELDAMEKHFVTLSNGSRFKVVSNNLVFVLLLSGNPPTADSFEGPLPAGFYTSTDGGYVGKEFIFMASQGLSGAPYRILALEPSEVTIYEESGDVYASFSLRANEFKTLAFKAFRVYRVVSTGNLMIQSDRPEGGGDAACYNERTFYLPSPEGGFYGRIFYSWSVESWDTRASYGFRISSSEDAKVTVWDARFNRKLQEFTVKGGVGASVKPKADEIMIESDKPITVALIHNGSLESGRTNEGSYGAGVYYIGVKANEETPFFIPTNASFEAYIFAYEDSVVNIDDVTIKIHADSYFQITTPGNHKVLSDKDIVIQVIHWPAFPPGQGIQSFGVVVPCIQRVNAKPNVTLTPLRSEGDQSTTYIIAGAILLLVITVGVILMKRRSLG